MKDAPPVPHASALAWGIYRISMAQGMSRADLERSAGAEPGYIRDLYRAKSKKPAADKISAIAEALGRPVEDLIAAGNPALRDQQVEKLAEEAPNKGILLEIWKHLHGPERERAIRFMLDLLSRRSGR